MNYQRCTGFGPVFCKESRVLILGSFPSVKSRAEGFYYGNPQNRFWRTVATCLGGEVPKTIEEKREFILRNKIALWDVVMSCEIAGSSDASIRNEQLADVPALLAESNVRTILCNGSTSYQLLSKAYPQLLPITKKLSSTSPANPRFSLEEWRTALKETLGE